MEGRIQFHAQHTPSWDTFETVTLSAGIGQVGGYGSILLTKEVSLEEARAFAAQIEEACRIVEADQ